VSVAKLSNAIEYLISQVGNPKEKFRTVRNLPPVPDIEEVSFTHPRVIEMESGKVAVLPMKRRRGR
jgi:hypothetical protein